MCYVVGLSSLSRVKIFLSFSVLGGGKRLCFLLCFLSPPREGNFGLHSTRFNYSSFYGIAPVPTSTGAVRGPTVQLTTATGCCAAGSFSSGMIPAGGLQSRKNAHSASGSLELRGQGKDTSTVSHSTPVSKEGVKENSSETTQYHKLKTIRHRFKLQVEKQFMSKENWEVCIFCSKR